MSWLFYNYVISGCSSEMLVLLGLHALMCLQVVELCVMSEMGDACGLLFVSLPMNKVDLWSERDGGGGSVFRHSGNPCHSPRVFERDCMCWVGERSIDDIRGWTVYDDGPPHISNCICHTTGANRVSTSLQHHLIHHIIAFHGIMFIFIKTLAAHFV